jgi:protein SCO1
MIRPLARTAVATAIVGAVGFVALFELTRGFKGLTSEAARRDAVQQSPVVLPVLQGIDQDGRRHPLFSDTEGSGLQPRVAIVDFIYTRCAGVCSSLGGSYQQLQAEIRARHLEGQVRLITVSFDPKHDTAEILAAYARRMRVDSEVWTLVSPQRPEHLPSLLAAFGIVVVPAPMNQFQHNAAFHVLDLQGRLARIVDLDDPHGALEAAISVGRSARSMT